MAIDWGQLLSTIGSVAGAVAPVAGGVLAQQGAQAQGNQQNQILQMLLARAAQGVGPTGTTNAQGGTSSFNNGTLSMDSGVLAPLQQLFQSVSQQALGTSQQSTEAAVLERLRAAAMPQENIQANSVANRLFNTGRLGTTGGANIMGQLSQAQQQADLQRQLAAGQESRTAQSSALERALAALRGNQNISTQTLNEFQTGANAAIGSTAAANAGLGSAAALTANPNFNTSAGTDAIASILSGGLGGTGAGSGASGLLQQLLGGGSSGQPGLLQQLFGGGGGAATSGLGSLGGAAFDSWLTSAGPISASAPADISAFLSGLGSSGTGAGAAAGLAPVQITGAAANGAIGGGAAAGSAAASTSGAAAGMNLATLGPIGLAIGAGLLLRQFGDVNRSSGSGTTNPYAGLFTDMGYGGVRFNGDPQSEAWLRSLGAVDPNSGLRWESNGGRTTYYNPDGTAAYVIYTSNPNMVYGPDGKTPYIPG